VVVAMCSPIVGLLRKVQICNCYQFNTGVGTGKPVCRFRFPGLSFEIRSFAPRSSGQALRDPAVLMRFGPRPRRDGGTGGSPTPWRFPLISPDYVG